MMTCLDGAPRFSSATLPCRCATGVFPGYKSAVAQQYVAASAGTITSWIMSLIIMIANIVKFHTADKIVIRAVWTNRLIKAFPVIILSSFFKVCQKYKIVFVAALVVINMGNSKKIMWWHCVIHTWSYDICDRKWNLKINSLIKTIQSTSWLREPTQLNLPINGFKVNLSFYCFINKMPCHYVTLD